jgi:hypothetical protein
MNFSTATLGMRTAVFVRRMVGRRPFFLYLVTVLIDTDSKRAASF